MAIWAKFKKSHLLIFSLLLNSVSSANNIFNDWRPLPDSQSICQGQYLPPFFSKKQRYNQDLIAQAHNTQILANGKTSLQGNVLISHAQTRLHTDNLTLLRNPKTNQIISGQTSGNILFEQPNKRIAATKALFTTNPQITQLFNNQYRIYDQHARGKAAKITIKGTNYVNLDQVNYTTCAPNNTFWQLSAKKLILNKQQNSGQAYDSVLKIAGIPILYTPYLSFPITKQRKSGFLVPSFGSLNNHAHISIPYYFNLAPNYDLLFTPQWYNKQGVLFATTTRYLANYHTDKLQLDFIPQDKQTHTNRYLISWQDSFQKNPYLQGYINYNKLSDPNFLKDFGKNINSTNTLNIDKTLNLDYTDTYNSVALLAQSWQSLEPTYPSLITNYNLTPGVSWSNNYPLLGKKFPSSFQFDIDHFNRTNQAPLSLPKEALRVHFVPQGNYNWHNNFAYIKPNLRLDAKLYNLETNPSLSQKHSIQKFIPSFTIDNGLYIDRNININHHPYLQTLEPRLTYLYTPYVNQENVPLFDTSYQPLSAENIYNINRFTGYDRISNSNQLIFATTSRWINQTTGQQKNLITLGEQLQFTANKVNLCWPNSITDSSVACLQSLSQNQNKNHFFALLNHQLNQRLSWQGDLILANQTNHIYTTHLGMNYMLNPTKIINLSLYKSNDSDSFPGTQVHFSTAWKLTNHWNILGTSYYDLNYHDFINNFLGLEYESCCWALRVGARKWINPQDPISNNKDTQIYVEFALKGLGNFGQSYKSLAAEDIPGYEDRFAHL